MEEVYRRGQKGKDKSALSSKSELFGFFFLFSTPALLSLSLSLSLSLFLSFLSSTPPHLFPSSFAFLLFSLLLPPVTRSPANIKSASPA